jgi:hypothetical protein
VAAAEEHWDEGRVAILCDLSGCINKGDLLVIYDDEPRARLVEVKESDRASDQTRQFEQLRVTIDFLNTGMSDVLAQHRIFGPTERPRLRTHLAVLREQLALAERTGLAWSRAGDAYTLRAIDAFAVDRFGLDEEALERFNRRERAFARMLGIAWTGAQTYQFDSLSRLDRDASHPVSSTAPFSIFPFDDHMCAKLMLGYSAYRATLNLRLLLAAVERRGWKMTTLPDSTFGGHDRPARESRHRRAEGAGRTTCGRAAHPGRFRRVDRRGCGERREIGREGLARRVGVA